MTVTLSFDIEEFDFPVEIGRDIDFATQLSVSTEGLKALLSLLHKYSVKGTFYITANYAQNCPDMVRQIVVGGHEIASHDFYHATNSKSDPKGSKKVLEQISGCEIMGYRSPRLAMISSAELQEAGYRYNSSMNPTWIPGRYNNIRKPRSVFNEGRLINYPMSVSYPFRIPLFWISFHVMDLSFYKYLANGAIKKDGHLNLYFHPWEFSDRLNDDRFGMPWYIRKISGNRLITKLERFICYAKNSGCSFKTTKDLLGIDG